MGGDLFCDNRKLYMVQECKLEAKGEPTCTLSDGKIRCVREIMENRHSRKYITRGSSVSIISLKADLKKKYLAKFKITSLSTCNLSGDTFTSRNGLRRKHRSMACNNNRTVTISLSVSGCLVR